MSSMMASNVGAFGTPPKPSLIDPVKLSESPGNGIWAPEPAMLEKIAFSRAGTSNNGNNASSGFLANAPSNIFSMLQQSSSVANQRQMAYVPYSSSDRLAQQHQQLLFSLSNGSRIIGEQLPPASCNQQPQLMSNIGKVIGFGGMETARPNALPLGLAGNVKSVADLEMEMRLQQLKKNANTTDKVQYISFRCILRQLVVTYCIYFKFD